jgi:hypothetical protein
MKNRCQWEEILKIMKGSERMKVIKLVSFQSWDGNDGKKMRTVILNLQVGEEEKEVRLYQPESDPLPEKDDEFGEDWELKGKTDKDQKPFLQLSKKKTEKKFNYQKKEVSPRSYMINTVLPSVFPAVMGGAYTVKQITDKMEEFIQWAEGK